MKKIKIVLAIKVLSATVLFCTLLIAILLSAFSGYDNSLSDCSLNIPTPFSGGNQPTHPSLLSFEKEWNGYRYWMAYTPHPYASGVEEDPCIVASNDLYSWNIPRGFTNPLADNSETECEQYKDPHLVYRDDLDRIECWYLGRVSARLGGGNNLVLFRKYTYDGSTWSDYEVMNNSMKWLSQSVIWKDNQYHMWGIGYDLYNNKGQCAYLSSCDGYNWTQPVLCKFNGVDNGLDMWHGGVTYIDNTFHYVYIENEKQAIFHCTSNDGINYTKPSLIIQNDILKYDYLYRPILIKEGNEFFCFYGIVNYHNQWSISFSHGFELTKMNGIRKNEIQANNLNQNIYSSDNVIDSIRVVYNSISKLWLLIMNVIIVGQLIIVVILKGMKRTTCNSIFLVQLSTLALIVIMTYLKFRSLPFIVSYIGFCVAAFFMLLCEVILLYISGYINELKR